MLFAASALRAENLLPAVAEASVSPESDAAWRPHTWDGTGLPAVVNGGRVGGKCLMIESTEGGDLSWFHRVAVEPNTVYKLSGWIKTKDVEPTTGRGVVLNIHELGPGTPPLVGTNDWTEVSMVIRSGDHTQFQVNGTFGAWGLAKGKAWFDDLRLETIDMAGFEPHATIHADQPGVPINPFIYGQFIEHLGRCIYGGIWAEMLEDRKFYFPIADKYDPYRSLQNTDFPVVGASPWEVLGPAGSVTMVSEDAFVGDHTPQIAGGSGIRQRDLGVVAGKKYTGYVWLKAAAGSAGPVTVALVCDDNSDGFQPHEIGWVDDQYKQYLFTFTADATTDHAMLEIRNAGQTPVQVGTASLMPADNVRGMRRDTLALLKQLDAPMYRWPGGNFVSGYNWRDGLGPRDRRPPRRNPAWTGVEHNDVGIDEFIDFCREVGAEPMIAANTGFGDAYSAAQEVAYCNAPADTIGGSWRAKNGHPEPYHVRYWCVGNEMFGPWQLGFMQLAHYTQKHNRVARAMLDVDPDLYLVGVGDLGRFNRRHDPDQRQPWSRGMLEACGDMMSALSEHFYVGREQDDVAAHVAQIVDAVHNKAEGHRRMQAQVEGLGGRIVPIAMDEWNYWYPRYVYGELGCVYRLRDALGIAAGLHEYFRNSDIIHMAHYAQTVNVIGCIKTTKTGAFLSTTALPLVIYRQHWGTVPLAVSGDAEVVSLDVAAARTDDGRAITVGIVNPNGEAQTLRLDVDGAKLADWAELWRVAGDDPTAHNTVDQQPVAIEHEESVPFGSQLTVPAYSVSLYRVPLE